MAKILIQLCAIVALCAAAEVGTFSREAQMDKENLQI
jgi:hypothetical protein